jgi:hypothetical protein
LGGDGVACPHASLRGIFSLVIPAKAGIQLSHSKTFSRPASETFGRQKKQRAGFRLSPE